MLSIESSSIKIIKSKPSKEGTATYSNVNWDTDFYPVPAMLKVYCEPEKYQQEADCLIQARHCYIIELYGVIQDSPYKGALLFQYMSSGDLGSYLKSHDPDDNTRIGIALAMIQAVGYLSVAKIVHRDINCSSILLNIVNNAVSVKLADFRLARMFNEEEGYRSTSYCPSGSLGYIAPEIFKFTDDRTGPCLYTPKSDIYGLGMVLLCLGSDNVSDPYFILSNPQKYEFNKHHIRPYIGPEVSTFTREMFLACFEADPKKRIDADTLLTRYKAETKI
jgi:serine/threonine protein kinase